MARRNTCECAGERPNCLCQTPRIGRGAPGYCHACDEKAESGGLWCYTHAFMLVARLDARAIDAAADRAGISVACLIREAIAKTVEALRE